MESCPRCKASVFSEDKYCGTCGYKFDQDMKMPLVTKQDIKIEDVRSNLGNVYFKMGKYNVAKDIFNNILADNPQNQNALNMIDEINKIQEKEKISD